MGFVPSSYVEKTPNIPFARGRVHLRSCAEQSGNGKANAAEEISKSVYVDGRGKKAMAVRGLLCVGVAVRASV